ncbi:hypothetical protein WJX73_005561 [Symbiochloris irregularis]|uniref:SGNH hydrolase-type esterase domain-containing protein n=1 Tax=Symbiochloris irregularis TaxID=706552 RepID=A0AAW1NSK3_9CHLO
MLLAPRIVEGAPGNLGDPLGWRALHQQHSQRIAGARKLFARDPSQALTVLVYGASIMESWTGQSFGYPLEDAAQLKTAYDNHFSAVRSEVFGISGDCTEQLLWRLQNGEAPEGIGARLVICNIGTNDITELLLRDLAKQDELASLILGACQLLLQADSQLHVVLIGILPRASDWDSWGRLAPHWPNRVSAAIERVNWRLQQYCEGTDRASYCDCTPCFVAEGQLRRDLYRDDLMHPNAAGMDCIGSSLKPYILQIARS